MSRKKKLQNESTELTTYDSLDAYLKEVASYKKLTESEEKSLALNYYKNKDIESAYKLVTANLWLVIKIARKYQQLAKNYLDLIQEGNLGLMEAVKNFDPYKEVKLPSYAIWWIKAYIIRYLISNFRLVKIGTTQAQRRLFFNLKKEKEKLEREGIYPGTKLLAERLNVKENEIIEMEQRLGSEDVSVDAQIGDTEETLLNYLPDNQKTSEELIDQQNFALILKEALNEFSKSLNEKEKEIYNSRLVSEQKETLNDISVKINVSLERVRQIENNIKIKLKKFLTEKYAGIIDSIEF